MVMVHGALILTQVMFGGGSVVGKLGVSSFSVFPLHVRRMKFYAWTLFESL